MQNWIIEIMNQYGCLGVALLIAVENIFPPIPSEVILTFGGFLTTYSEMTEWGVIFAATVGSMIGAYVLYGAGYLIKPEKLARLVNGRAGKLLHLKPEDIYNAQNWFNSKGNLTVFFCRFIPIIRSLISVPAGMAKMSMLPFTFMTVTGSFIWNTVLVWLGAIAGASWERVAVHMHTYSEVGYVIMGLGAVLGIIIFYRKRKQKS